MRSQRQKNFRYQDINAVYTIVLFEHSPAEFHTFSDAYLHYFSQRSNTGLEIELLQKYLFIPLDIFRKIQYNTGERSMADMSALRQAEGAETDTYHPSQESSGVLQTMWHRIHREY